MVHAITSLLLLLLKITLVQMQMRVLTAKKCTWFDINRHIFICGFGGILRG